MRKFKKCFNTLIILYIYNFNSKTRILNQKFDRRIPFFKLIEKLKQSHVESTSNTKLDIDKEYLELGKHKHINSIVLPSHRYDKR